MNATVFTKPTLRCRWFGHAWRYTRGIVTGTPVRVCIRCVRCESGDAW